MSDDVTSPWPSSDGTLVVSDGEHHSFEDFDDDIAILHVTETASDYYVEKVGGGGTLADALRDAADAADDGEWDVPGREA